MTNEEKAREFAQLMFPDNICIWTRGNVEAEKVEYATLTMAKWKDEQYRIDKAHLDMVYEALDKLYKVRYGDQPILNTGNQTDVFMYMIEDIINETKQKK